MLFIVIGFVLVVVRRSFYYFCLSFLYLEAMEFYL
jgi:hypothetical protein